MTSRPRYCIPRLTILLAASFAVSIGLATPQTIARTRPSAIAAASTSVGHQSAISSGNVRIKRSANWSGDVATNHTYEDAYGSWRIPDVGKNTPGGSAAASSQWIGIGLGDSKKHPLVQAGSEADIHVGLNQISYYLWWQVVPEDSQQNVIDLGVLVKAGNLISAHIHLSRNNAYITLADEGVSTTIHFNRHGQAVSSDGHAEWIDERTELTFVNSVYPALADSTVTFTHAEASAPGLSKRAVGRLPHYANTMWTCKRPIVELAVPLKITQGGTKFTIQWKHFGHPDKPGCSPG